MAVNLEAENKKLRERVIELETRIEELEIELKREYHRYKVLMDAFDSVGGE